MPKNLALPDYFSDVPSLRKSARFLRDSLSSSLTWPLDRVNELGDDYMYGHTGCVNALSWAREGELLLSGGDDRTVRVWRMDPTNDDPEQPFPFTCRSIIRTGHRANIFNNKMLPHSTRIASVAGDHEVRVHDVGDVHSASHGPETTYSVGEACTHVIRCHRGAVKRIITEYSPDLFLTVSEDGTVRQHDLRTEHRCGRERDCPTPIVKVNHELTTMSLSPLTPYQLIVAGESPYGYLFDRRHTGRFLQEEWGIPPGSGTSGAYLTTCVRRFGRPRRENSDLSGVSALIGDHITGCKMSAHNGHEAIFSFSGDAVYLYSTLDDPAEASDAHASPILPSNETLYTMDEIASNGSAEAPSHLPDDEDMERDIDDLELAAAAEDDDHESDASGDNDEDEDADDEDGDTEDPDYFPKVPTVMPRRRFAGARNIRTVKDVNYLGPTDEFVVSGSDDGNVFIWRKDDGKLVDILEGDGEVVNVIEGHPSLPLFAVSGIDTTVKLFAPRPNAERPRRYSRMGEADHIVENNSRQRGPFQDFSRNMFLNFAAQAGVALANDADADLECRNQ
ncbi:WD40-repeat-containing domain protein [Schizophyllum amplum]|uniref:WD40-repeat-containing domain protein n=1 Tax=Schizophyllum amplum TaxID=97359 RepID=A0A550CSN5_9AGAR|nr:WD40-repeat-containing domain protein [Auriculariopsis ampla]